MIAALLFLTWLPADAGPSTADLVRQLDDRRFRVRRQAERELLRRGRKALPELMKAAGVRDGSAEVRKRAQRIVSRILEPMILGGFRKLVAAANGDSLDVLEGMTLMSQLTDPRVRRADLETQLDALAATVKRALVKELGEGIDLSKADPGRVVQVVRRVVFVEQGFTGNRQQYWHPDNSSLARVLKTRKGLPILLSHVVVEVGRRLKLPLVGLSVPGRYMVKYDGKTTIIIDAYNDGRVMSVEQMRKEYPTFDTTRRATDRAALSRMLTNFSSQLDDAGQHRQAALVERCQEILRKSMPP